MTQSGKTTGSQVNWVALQRECRLAREYDDYLRRKVEVARASMNAGRGRTNDEVEAAFSARRNQKAAGSSRHSALEKGRPGL